MVVDGADGVLSSASKRMELSGRDVSAFWAADEVADVDGPLDKRISNAFKAKALLQYYLLNVFLIEFI